MTKSVVEIVEEHIAEARRLRALNAELLEELERLSTYHYNPFEPDNQSSNYKRIQAVVHKARAAMRSMRMSQADDPICECGRQKTFHGGMGADVYICWPCEREKELSMPTSAKRETNPERTSGIAGKARTEPAS